MKSALIPKTFNDLRDVGYHLNLFCLPCRRLGAADLDGLLDTGGEDNSYVHARFKCPGMLRKSRKTAPAFRDQ